MSRRIPLKETLITSKAIVSQLRRKAREARRGRKMAVTARSMMMGNLMRRVSTQRSPMLRADVRSRANRIAEKEEKERVKPKTVMAMAMVKVVRKRRNLVATEKARQKAL